MYVQIKGLEFRYKNAKENTIEEFSLNIEKGEIVSILGESGSGKSTVLRIISGLEMPSKGTIKIDNKIMVDHHTYIPPEKRNLGMVFQDYALFPHMTVAENIKFGLKGLKNDEKESVVKKVLELVNLSDYHKRYPYELSGGQQQRVAIARAIAYEPNLLLLDEPFSNLDAHLQQKIRQELHKIIKQIGITSIFVTHDKEDALIIADKVVVLDKGVICQIGTPSEILL